MSRCPICYADIKVCHRYEMTNEFTTTTLNEAEKSTTSIERSTKNEKSGHNLMERAENISTTLQSQAANGGTNGR